MRSIKKLVQERFPELFAMMSVARKTVMDIFSAENSAKELQRKSLPAKIRDYYANNEEVREIITFLNEHPAEMISYPYSHEYRNKNIDVTKKHGLKTVNVHGNDIYFPPHKTSQSIKQAVRTALLEQDYRSPHRYLPAGSTDIKGKIAVLCGASDGIYALEIVDKFEKIYLFEADDAWVAPLKKTLEKYLHKIEIVPYFVSDTDTDNAVKLDTFFSRINISEIDYIQADIEDSELRMLHGAKHLLERSRNLILCLCCYHTSVQQDELTKFLQHYHYKVETSRGFVLMWGEIPLNPPYLRRGVIYARK